MWPRAAACVPWTLCEASDSGLCSLDTVCGLCSLDSVCSLGQRLVCSRCCVSSIALLTGQLAACCQSVGSGRVLSAALIAPLFLSPVCSVVPRTTYAILTTIVFFHIGISFILSFVAFFEPGYISVLTICMSVTLQFVLFFDAYVIAHANVSGTLFALIFTKKTATLHVYAVLSQFPVPFIGWVCCKHPVRPWSTFSWPLRPPCTPRTASITAFPWQPVRRATNDGDSFREQSNCGF